MLDPERRSDQENARTANIKYFKWKIIQIDSSNKLHSFTAFNCQLLEITSVSSIAEYVYNKNLKWLLP